MKVQVDWRASVGLVGTVLKWLALPIAFPLSIAAYHVVVSGADPGKGLMPLLAAVVVTVALGLGLEWVGEDTDLRGREAFLMVALSWFGVAFSALCRSSSPTTAFSPTPSTRCSRG